MNFEHDDIHRSLRRWVTWLLPDVPVWTQRDEIRDDERPVGVVESAGPSGTGFARSSVPQGDVQKTRPWTITLYPELADTARESRHAAAQMQQLLDNAITRGVVDLVEEVQVQLAPPLTIPIFDWSGVPLSGAGREGPANDAPYGYADISDATVNLVQDPIDPLRFTVPVDLRLTWWEAGRHDPDGPIVTRMPGTANVR